MVTVTVDKFGRLVIPREIRQRHGWRAGTVLELHDSPRGLEVTARADTDDAPSGWAWRDGILVCVSAANTDISNVSAIRDALDAQRDHDLGSRR